MNIYIDESGSINNKLKKEYFIISLIMPNNLKTLKKSYKRFVSSNYKRLQEIDDGKMFLNGQFRELKGSSFDKKMKQKFVDHFTKKNNFSLFYIIIDNEKINDIFCSNKSRAFNYVLKKAMEYFINNNLIPSEEHILQLDERNERTESRFFLEDYLNTELFSTGINKGKFNVIYFDSSTNVNIQIADVFSNLYYSHLKTNAYKKEIRYLEDRKILKGIFIFPLQ